jgi:hypothetical protein
MAVDLQSTSFAYAVKSLWPQKRMANLMYEAQPALAMIPKDTNFGGANRVIGVRYAQTPGVSVDFTTAQTNKSANGGHKGAKFTITRMKNYGIASIDGETIEASKGQPNALAEALDTEIESTMHGLRRSTGIALFRDGSGAIGRRASISTNTITLSDKRDASNFEVGMYLRADDTASGASPRTGTTYVTAVDRDAGTVTVEDASDVTSFADNDYLFRAGDQNGHLKGFGAWLPATAPTSGDNFFGVDRSVDPVRLAGKRIDISSLSPAEGLVEAVNKMKAEGASPDAFFCHWDQWANVHHDLGTKVVYEQVKVGELMFDAIKVGGVKLVPDINCPSGYGYLLTLNTWKLATLGPLPRFMDIDGQKLLREASSDAYEVRIGYYGQLYCEAPGRNAVVTMPTLST